MHASTSIMSAHYQKPLCIVDIDSQGLDQPQVVSLASGVPAVWDPSLDASSSLHPFTWATAPIEPALPFLHAAWRPLQSLPDMYWHVAASAEPSTMPLPPGFPFQPHARMHAQHALTFLWIFGRVQSPGCLLASGAVRWPADKQQSSRSQVSTYPEVMNAWQAGWVLAFF